MRLSVKEAAVVLGCTPRMVRISIANGKLKAVKDEAGHWCIEQDVLHRALLKRAYNVKALADFLHLHPETVRRMLRENRIHGYHDGTSWVVNDYNILRPVESKKK
jgi:excisionase family DNA binding protein